MLVACVIPVGDAVIVLTHGGPAAVAFGVHGATAAVGIAGAVALLRGARRAVPESVRRDEVRV
jgi:hypothetical protein